MSQTMASSNEANASVQQQQQRRRCVRWGGSTSHNNNNNNNNNSSNDDRVGGGGECEAWGRTRSPPRGARAQCMRVESLLQPRDDNEYNDNNSNNDDDDDDGNGNTHATVAAVAVSSTPPLWLAPCAQPSWQHRTTSAIITTAAAAAETPLAMCCDDVGSGSRDAACCTRAAYTVDADNNNNNAAPLLLLLQQQQQQQQQRPTPQRRVSRSLASIRHVAVATARALVSGNNSNSAAARAGGAGGATRAHASSAAAAGPEVAAGLSSRDAASLQQRGCSRASAAAAAAAAAATGVQLHNSSEVRRGDDNLRAYYRAAGDEDADDDDTTPQRHVCRHRRCRDSDDSDSDEDSTDGRVFQRSTTSTQLTSEYSMHRKTMSDVSTSQGGGTGSSSSSSSSASLSRSLRGRVCLRVSASTALAVYLCLCLIVVFLLAFLPFHISYSHVISGLIRSSLSNAISFASFTTTNRFMSFMMLVRSLTAHTLLCDELADADVCAEYNATRAALAMAFAMVRFQPTVKRWSMYRGNDDDVNSNSNSNISNSSNNSSIVTSSDDLRTGLFADVQFAGQDVLVAANNTRAVTTPRVRLDMLTLLAMSEGSSSSSSSSHHEHGTGPAVPLPGESQFDILVDPARPWMRDVYLAQLHNGTGAFHDAWVPGPQAMSRGYSQLYVVPFASRNTTGFCLTVPNLVSMFEGIRPLVPLLREHGRMIIVDVANNVSVYQSWQNSSLDATTTTSAATATSLASSSSPSSALPRAAAVTADTVANTDTNKDNGEAADRLEPPLTLSMSMTAVVRPVPYDQLDDAMVRAAMAEVQRRGGVQALMQAHGPMRMRYGRSNILLNVTSSMTAMNTLPFATLIFLLESDFLDTLRHTTTIVLCVCAVVAVVMTVCAFVTAHYAMRALRRLVPDIQRLSALEIPSHTTATTTAAATMTTTDTPAATRAHADEADNHHQQHLGGGVSARTLRVADEDATAATAPTTAGSGARLLTRAATTRRGCRRVAAAVWRRVRAWVRGAVCWLQQRGSRAWHWLATWQMSYTELWRVARACDELRASLRVMKSLMPQAVMTTSASATTAAAAAVAVLDNTTTTALAPPVSDVVSELEDTMHVADVVVALHANVNDCNRTRGHDACGDTARAIELQRNRRVNTLILMDKPYVFARRAFTLVYIVGHGVPMHLMQAMLGALMECVLLYNGCVEQLGHSHALISFGAHASLPMHAAKGCNFALDMYRQHCTHAPGYPVVFVVDTNEYAVGTCGTHKNSARVVLGTNYLVDTARVLYNIHCSIAATPAATSHLPDYQSVPIECIRVDSVNVPLVLCELRPVTPQSDVAQMTADAVHFRAGFFCMRLGMYGHALSHYRAIQCRSDRQAQRLLDVCQQRCAALDTSPYMGLSTNTYYFRPWRRSSVDGGNNNNNNNGSGAARAVVSNAARQRGDDDNARNEANAMHSDKAHASTASQQQQQQHRVDDNDNGDAMQQQQQHRRHHHRHHRRRRRGPRVGTASTLDTSAAASSQTLLLQQQQQSLWTLPRPTADVVVSPRQEGQQRRSSSSSNNDDDDDSDDSDDHSSSSSNGSSSASSKDDHDSPRLNAQTRGSDDGGGGDDGGRGGGNNSSSDNNNNNTSATAAAAANERYNASTATALFDVIYMPSSSREELTDVVDTTSGAPTATVPLTFRDVDGCVWYRSLRPIGEGAFSTVYLGMSEKGLQVAIKCIARCRRDAQEQSIADELHIAARLRHPNVVSYISCSVTLTHFAIFMELVPGGSLHAVQKQFGALTEAVVRRFIMDILNGLIYLHKNGVVHCDIKPHNMLLDVNGVCKLSDFGSTIMGDSLKGNNNNNNRQDGDGTVCDVDEPPRVRGTVLYMAPEVAVGGPCTTQSDIFSFGASLLELLLGRVPWCWTASAPPGSNAASLQRLLRHEMMFVSSLARGEVELRVPDTLGYEAQNVARACCRLVPAERPSAQELMRFPFFT